MRKAGYTSKMEDVSWDTLTDDAAYELIKVLSRKGNTIAKACETDEPSMLAQYTLEIAEAAHRFIHQDRVLGSAEEKSRLFLVQSSQIVLENVLDLLGLFPIRQM